MNSLQQELVNLIPTVIIIVIISAVVIFYVRRKPSSSALMGLEELSRLKKKELMSPEEIKRVREAMARQYLEQEKEAQEKKMKKAMTPLQLLALEAQKVDLKKEKPQQKLAEGEVPPPLPKGLLPTPEFNPAAGEKPTRQPLPALSPKLQTYLNYPESEWEILVQVGFLTEAEHQLLKRHRAQKGSE